MPFDSTVTDTRLAHDLRTLRLARSYISTPDLWCKRTMQDTKDRRRCMVGAVRHALFVLRTNFSTTEETLAQYLPLEWQRKYRASTSNMVHFNDAPITQHSDVLAVFDRAIDDISNRLGVP